MEEVEEVEEGIIGQSELKCGENDVVPGDWRRNQLICIGRC